ncbi:MAG TPA: TIGR03621 family F420-dependent LLM class oxidoreductase [Ktedonobacteraceae bacterium]|nr:TIGR03621 family F420-dependent LLM class oxidoreductase [Ktedonobacteraceae bacterium]
MNVVGQRPFRFGVATAHIRSRGDWVAQARKIEELGYDTLLVVDHLTTSLGPLVALAVAAEVTERIRVGSFVLCNDFRHPAILAKELATLDVLSEGRFEFGLGSGYMPSDYQQAGLKFDSPGMRVSRFEEAIHLFKHIFSAETVNFQGEHYTITNLQGLPKPAQRPHPPIYIGGGGQRVLSFAAREADIVGIAHKSGTRGLNLANTTAEPTAQKIAWVREAAGERFARLELSVMVFQTHITEQRDRVAEQIGQRVGLSAAQVLDSMQLLVGTVDQVAETLWTRRETYGISYIVVTEEQIEKFAPVVARLAGK